MVVNGAVSRRFHVTSEVPQSSVKKIPLLFVIGINYLKFADNTKLEVNVRFPGEASGKRLST